MNLIKAVEIWLYILDHPETRKIPGYYLVQNHRRDFKGIATFWTFSFLGDEMTYTIRFSYEVSKPSVEKSFYLYYRAENNAIQYCLIDRR